MSKIGLYGGSFNPPGLHHRNIISYLLNEKIVDKVVVIPCGTRPDKELLPIEHRKSLISLNFGDIQNLEIDFRNLDFSTFTSTYKLNEIYKDKGEIWHILGEDLIASAPGKQSPFMRKWYQAEYVWNNFNFIIVKRKEANKSTSELPPHSIYIDKQFPGSSTEIRKCVSHSSNLLSSVKKYLHTHTLFNS